MKVLLVGCGRVGKAIAEGLIKKPYLNAILLYDKRITNSMTLASYLKSKKVKVALDNKKVKNPDYVVIALSNQSNASRLKSFNTRKTTHQARKDELLFNLSEMAKLANDLKVTCKNSKIIIVTNPVDEFTNYLRIIMKYDDIIGFGASLDALRYSKYLKKKVLCIGEHGKIIPLLGLESKKDYKKLRSVMDVKVVKTMNKEGMTHKAVGKEFSVFFDKLNGNKETVLAASYFLKRPYFGIKNISISIPLRVKNGKIISPVEVKVSALEKELFLEEVKELRRSVMHILNT